MSKAPHVKPQNAKFKSICGNFNVYIYWTPHVLNDGSVVFHKHINKRPVLVKDPNKPRKSRKTEGAPLTQSQMKIQKRKLLNLLKNQILNNDNYTLDNTIKLYEKFATPTIINAF